jgi:hypothetical protein
MLALLSAKKHRLGASMRRHRREKTALWNSRLEGGMDLK